MKVKVLSNRTVEGTGKKSDKPYKFESLQIAVEDPENPGVYEKGEYADWDCNGYQPGEYQLDPSSIGMGMERNRSTLKLRRLVLRPVKAA